MLNWRPIATALMAILAITSVGNRALPQSKQSVQASLADLQTYPEADRGFIYYLDTDPWVGEERADLEAAIKLMVCSTSLKQSIDRMIPQKSPALAGSSLLRIDLRELGWSIDDWIAVLKTYPYIPTDKHIPRIPRADWLLVELADMQDSKSGAYLRLLFGGGEKAPKNRDDILKRLGVSNEQQYVFGLIEGKSGVAIRKGGRVIESRPVKRGYAYITRDVLQLDAKRDPLENLLDVSKGANQHDGEEVIVMIPKTYGITIGRGTLPIYFLSDGKGNLVNRAPVDLVEDTARFRGLAEIRFPGACLVSCHSAGYNMPTLDEFRLHLDRGVFAFDKQKDAAAIAEFFSSVRTEIERANDDQQLMIEFITAMQHKEAANAFKRAVDRYDAPLGMQEVAEEYVAYGFDVQDIVGAIELAANEGRIGSRMSGVARNLPIDRVAFEDQYVPFARELKRFKDTQ